jgi:hypothetical protein
MRHRLLYAILLALFIGSGMSVKAQQVNVKASIDSTHILIGDQLKLLLEVEKPKDLNVQFPQVPDTFSSNVEVVNRSKIDTLKLDDKTRQHLTQTLYITSFDSGKHQIPPFYFRLKNGQVLDSAATRQLMFEVHTMKIDTTKGPVDIKTVYGAPVTLKEVMPYILGVILIAALIFFIFYYIRWKKKNKPLFVKPEKPAEPAHIVALRELDRIKAQKLWQQEKIKQYYSEISDTIRTYIVNRFEIPAMEQTSGETINAFKPRRDLVDEKTLDQLQHILSLADLVKFAKYSPLPDDNNLTLMNAYFFVNQTKKEEIKAPEKPNDDAPEEEVVVQ